MKTDRNQSIVDCHKMGMSHAEIAIDFEISRERVRQVVKTALGDSTPLKRKHLFLRDIAVKAHLAIESGNGIDSVAKEYDLSVSKVEEILKSNFNSALHVLEFKAWMRTQLGMTYGHWTILSIEPENENSTSQRRCRSIARCELCGTTHCVSVRNMMIGRSTMCQKCAAKHRKPVKPVLDRLYATIYNNLKEASIATGVSYSQARRRMNTEESRFIFLTQEQVHTTAD